MSSETSTDGAPRAPGSTDVQPWQFFVLAGLALATVVVYLQVFVWKADRAGAILISLTIGAAAMAGLAAYRTFIPLTGVERGGPEMLGGRTRAALEREKALVLRAIKDLEFDRAMKKVSEKDFLEMQARLRQRAARLLVQLDRGTSYRDEIEKELARRIGAPPAAAIRTCSSCSTPNDVDAKFCKSCGAKLESVS
jgi:hypothetical protein